MEVLSYNTPTVRRRMRQLEAGGRREPMIAVVRSGYGNFKLDRALIRLGGKSLSSW